MSLVPCRACGHMVDTSALACPECGATDPAHKISRQQRNAISFVVQFAVICGLLALAGWFVVHTVIPMARDIIFKPQAEQQQGNRPY